MHHNVIVSVISPSEAQPLIRGRGERAVSLHFFPMNLLGLIYSYIY